VVIVSHWWCRPRLINVDTAYVKSSKGWMYCEDSKVSKAQERDVVVSVIAISRTDAYASRNGSHDLHISCEFLGVLGIKLTKGIQIL
jgi:hypothetical protein